MVTTPVWGDFGIDKRRLGKAAKTLYLCTIRGELLCALRLPLCGAQMMEVPSPQVLPFSSQKCAGVCKPYLRLVCVVRLMYTETLGAGVLYMSGLPQR